MDFTRIQLASTVQWPAPP